MHAETLAAQFAIGDFVLSRNAEGISHEESIRSPQPGGNTINWVVGHVVRARNQTLELLGRPRLFDDDEFVVYGAAAWDSTRALPFVELTRRFSVLSGPLAAALGGLSREDLSMRAPFSPTNNPDETLGSLLASMAFHESYHLGQTGILRRLLGHRGALLAPGEQGHP